MVAECVARTAVDIVAEQARRTPDAVAVEAAGRSLTYRELHGRAVALAARLCATVKFRDGEDTFAVYEGPRDERFAVAALGVLGARVLPGAGRPRMAAGAAGRAGSAAASGRGARGRALGSGRRRPA
jgi:non-ribosomal peptide synthetase component E (peptide arylation enzyme)